MKNKLEINLIKNKGVTLIALVVTITVLLILATVSITAINGNNGIINKANEADDKTTAAAVQEALNLQIVKNAEYDKGDTNIIDKNGFIKTVKDAGVINDEDKIVVTTDASGDQHLNINEVNIKDFKDLPGIYTPEPLKTP